MNIISARHFVRLKPFDSSTEDGRSNERYRLAAISILTSILSRALSMAVMVMSVRLTIPYLGVERFGIWMTVASFAGLLTFLDLGVGNALTNHVAKRAALDSKELLRQTISGGLAFVALIGIFMGAVLWIVAAFIPWSALIKLNNPNLLSEARAAAMCFSVLFGINIFTTSLQRIFAGLQQAFVSNLVASVGSVIAGIGIWMAATTKSDIPILLTIMLGSQSIASIVLIVILVRRRLVSLKGILRQLRTEVPYLYRTGGLFFVLQIGTMVGWGADSLIISSTLGVAQVAIYSITQRLFQFVSQPLGMMNAPLWGSYADAHARGEKKFLRKTFKNSLVITLMVSAVAGCLVLIYHKNLVGLWTGGAVEPQFAVASAFFVWTMLETLGNSIGIFLNGCNVVREQVVTVVVLTCIAIPVKIYFIHIYGIVGMLSSYALTYFIVVVFMYAIFYRKSIEEKIK